MDLGGSFHRSFEENTEGYSVLVTEYEILEKEKYFERHHLTTSNQSVADPYQYIMEVSPLRFGIKITKVETSINLTG